MRRAVGIALLFVTALGACSGGPDRYGSAAAVAAALRASDVSCESYTAGTKTAELVADQGSCTSGDSELVIYVFDDVRARDRWLGVGESLGDVVVGPNWVVGSREGAAAVADALNAEIR